MIKHLFITGVIFSLTACGGDSSSQSVNESTNEVATPPVVIYTGVFLDSAVEGLSYKTASQSGKTNNVGEFVFQSDELITFSIGSITFPEIKAGLLITPLDVFNTSDINNSEVVNLLRLLQSVDTDGDASNNIQISEEIHSLATGLILNFSDENFDILVNDLITMSGLVSQQLISAQQAIDHFQLTLNQINGVSNIVCEKTHSMVGYSGFFETFNHNVAGKATIIDDCTIEITQFDYDGGGPAVYFYGAIDHVYDGIGAFAIGEKINGQIYDNADITLKLPQKNTLDDLTGLSIWCVDFNANFGQMTFTP